MFKNNTGKQVEKTLRTLKREYALVGKRHIRGWKAILVTGLIVGAAAGIIFVANQSGEFEFGEARVKGKRLPVPTNVLTNGEMILFRWSYTAVGKDEVIQSLTLTLNSTNTMVSNLSLYGYTDPSFTIAGYTNPIATYPAALGNGKNKIVWALATSTAPVNVPAGQTRYFELKGITETMLSNARLAVSIQGLGTQVFKVPSAQKNITKSTKTATTTSAFTVTLATSTPASKSVPAGSNDVTATVLKFTGKNEEIRLTQLALQFDGRNPSSVSNYTLWDGEVLVGTGIFPPGNSTSTALISAFTIPALGDKLMTIKIDISSSAAADRIGINYDGNRASETKGFGSSSGLSVHSGNKRDTRAPKIIVIPTR